jgi:hypothetical protein
MANTDHVVTCPRCGHTGPVAQFGKRQAFNKGATTTMYSFIQKAAAMCDDHELPEVFAKGLLTGQITAAEGNKFLEERAIEKKLPGETVPQASVRLYIGDHRSGPDDPNGARIFATQRKYELAHAGGRKPGDPIAAEIFKRSIAA